MDDHSAIEFNRMALLRVVAAIGAMAGLGDKSANEAAGRGAISRNFYLVLLRLLRPAEAAARRLVVALARRLPPAPALAPLIFPKAGEATFIQLPRTHEVGMMVPLRLVQPAEPPAATPSKPNGASRFRLLDPLPDPFPAPVHSHTRVAPCIRSFDDDSSFRSAEPDRPTYSAPDAAFMAARATQRLAALSRVLGDLPDQARRYLRWQARRDRAVQAGLRHRSGALRPGRPPGALSYDPALKPSLHASRIVEEIDGILTDAHNLARRTVVQRE